MGTPFSGRLAYAYVGGGAVTNLKGWNGAFNKSVIALEPDIGSSWNYSDDGFKDGSFTIDFNLTSDDFNDLFDAWNGSSAVSMYLYTKRSAGIYLYGSAWLTNLNVTAQVSGTVSGSLSIQTNGEWARQTTA